MAAPHITAARIRTLALDCGFELAGVAPPSPAADAKAYLDWCSRGMAGGMGYLTDHRAAPRADPRRLLPNVRSIICAGKLYHTAAPLSIDLDDPERAWISRYAWGDDYHDVLRRGLTDLAVRLEEITGPFDYKICADTAPLLERSYARLAGLGWIGRNTCLINEPLGSWFFLGELLTSLELGPGAPPPDRCGTCRACIDACPTQALVEGPAGRWELDARLCISYWTIELRGPLPKDARPGRHVFGCDICQDVCPWNRRAPVTADPAFAAREVAPPLERLAALSEAEFRETFRASPVLRSKYAGFLRNVAAAMGDSGSQRFREPLAKLEASSDTTVAQAARNALERLGPGEPGPRV